MLDTVSFEEPQGDGLDSALPADFPRWGEATDGSFVKLVPDVDLQADFAAWQAEECAHDKQFTGKTVNSIGGVVYRRYCKTCGRGTTSALPHRTVEGLAITVIDEAKRERVEEEYRDRRSEGLRTIANRAAARQQVDRRSEYADYLDSSEWRARRRLVLERCDGICEGCRTAQADEVHHLTYQHVGREFLFELVGLCSDCHSRWHEREA